MANGIPQPRMQGGRHVQAPPPHRGSSNAQTPNFDLASMAERYCVLRASKEAQAEFARFLRSLGRLSWQQIQLSTVSQIGYESIPRFQIVGQVRNHIPTAVAAAMSFKLRPRIRVIGYRDDRTLHVVALDCDLSTYPH